MVYSDDRTEREEGKREGRAEGQGGRGERERERGGGEERRKGGWMKLLLPVAYPYEVGPRESLAHSVDYVDPQVGPFPMAERAHNPAIAGNVGRRRAVRLFARDPGISVDPPGLRVQTRTLPIGQMCYGSVPYHYIAFSKR